MKSEKDKKSDDEENNKSDSKNNKKNSDNKKSSKEDRNIASSLNRTINKIYEYARANKWEYFVTLTFNNKIDRYNYNECSKCVKSFIDDIRRNNPNMKYIIVPELHKDKAYHFHGVFSDIPNIELINSGIYSLGKYTFKREKIPPNLIEKCRLIYNMGRYNYGYSDIQKVENTEKTANYITKYITKELVTVTKGKKRYWTSRNLKKPVVTEILLEGKHKEQMKELIRDKVIHEKQISVDVGGYQSSIEYIDIKTEDMGGV